jgi:cell wall-associated NlpC family hydrolase
MNWTDSYIEIPFKPDGRDRNGLDCYGLVCLVYRDRLGIILPDYKGVFADQSIDTLKKVSRVMAEGREEWTKVDTPKPFDMVMLRTGRYTWHVGIVIDNRRMLHITSGIESCVEEYTGRYWGNRVEEFRRWDRA